MIDIRVNGDTLHSKATNLQLLIDELMQQGTIQDGFAAALNGGFVPKANYVGTVLMDGDEVEILSPMQGG